MARKSVTGVDELSDVDTTTSAPAVGEVLQWDGTNWAPAAAGAGSLTALSDTTITAPANNEILVFNGTVWVNDTPANVAASMNLGELGDVTLTALASGEVLSFNGTIWVNTAPVQFGEYNGTFDASIGDFVLPAAAVANDGDWFNTTTAGTVDGQAFAVGDILIALLDAPSTTTFAGNWTLVPNLSVTTFDSLTDVIVPAPVLNDIVQWNGANWVNVTTASLVLGGVSQHTDVDTTGAANTDMLQFNGTNWVDVAVGAFHGLTDHTDVVITAAAANEVLMFDGANWVDTASTLLPLGSITLHSDVDTTGAATDDLLVFNGTTWVDTPPDAIPTRMTVELGGASGTVAVGDGTGIANAMSAAASTLKADTCAAVATTAPTGATMTFDVRLEPAGTVITTGTIAIGANVATFGAFIDTAITAAQWIETRVTQVGSTIPGSELTVNGIVTIP